MGSKVAVFLIAICTQRSDKLVKTSWKRVNSTTPKENLYIFRYKYSICLKSFHIQKTAILRQQIHLSCAMPEQAKLTNVYVCYLNFRRLFDTAQLELVLEVAYIPSGGFTLDHRLQDVWSWREALWSSGRPAGQIRRGPLTAWAASWGPCRDTRGHRKPGLTFHKISMLYSNSHTDSM